ncbi:MAG TPA: hypothetical protein PKA64_18465, partial [Myxococcota bacterium]|nr:hypothetical protein [Myxococcota bacterium]
MLPAITALALLVLAWLALSSTWARNEAVRERVTDEARAELRGHVSAWDLGLQRALDDMVVDVRLAGDVEEVQGKLRRRVPWLDSVYVWTPSRVDFGGAHHDGAFVFPPRETDAFPDDPCVEPATAALINAPAALPECLGSAASTVLRTTNGAAEQLIRAGRADDAAL